MTDVKECQATPTDDQIKIANNHYQNIMKLTLVFTTCLVVVGFVTGMVINMINTGNPLQDGVISTTLLPLIDLFRIIVGV
jgi:hypothetical protein